MKKISAIIVFSIMSLSGLMAGDKSGGEQKVKLVIVGINDLNFIHPDYSNTELANLNGIGQDEVLQFYNNIMKASFEVDMGDNVSLDYLNSNLDEYGIRLNYASRDKGMNHLLEVNLSDLAPDKLATFMESQNADYAIFITKYEINYEGDPYFSIKHAIDMELLDRSGKVILLEESSFLTDELKSYEETKEKYHKAVKKLHKKIDKKIL